MTGEGTYELTDEEGTSDPPPEVVEARVQALATEVVQSLLAEVAPSYEVRSVVWDGHSFRAELVNDLLVARGFVGVVNGSADEDEDAVRARARMLDFALGSIEASGIVLRFGVPLYVEVR